MLASVKPEMIERLRRKGAGQSQMNNNFANANFSVDEEE